MPKTKTNPLNQIRRYRLKRGFSQKEVAQLMGYKAQSPVSQWEAGTRLPDLANAFKLCAILKCMPEVLFGELHDQMRHQIFLRKRKLNLWERYDDTQRHTAKYPRSVPRNPERPKTHR